MLPFIDKLINLIQQSLAEPMLTFPVDALPPLIREYVATRSEAT